MRTDFTPESVCTSIDCKPAAIPRKSETKTMREDKITETCSLRWCCWRKSSQRNSLQNSRTRATGAEAAHFDDITQMFASVVR